MAKKASLDEKAKEARRAYKRQWARDNPEKIRAQQKRYWQKKAQEMETAAAGGEAK